MWQGSLGFTDAFAVHGALLSGRKRVLILIACLLPEPSSAHFSSVPWLASISTTLDRIDPTRLVLSLPKDSRGLHHCFVSNALRLVGTGLPWSRSAHSARDRLTDKDLRVNTAHFFYLHGESELELSHYSW